MRFVEYRNQQINVDNIDAITAEHCGACGWHYFIVAKMAGGQKIQLDSLSWDQSWPEYGSDEGWARGRQAIDDAVAEAVRALEMPPPIVRCFKTRGEIEAGGISEAGVRARVAVRAYPDDVTGFWLYDDGSIEPYTTRLS